MIDDKRTELVQIKCSPKEKSKLELVKKEVGASSLGDTLKVLFERFEKEKKLREKIEYLASKELYEKNPEGNFNKIEIIIF